MAEAERSVYSAAGMRPEPLLLPQVACAARLPRGFRRLLDDFAREVLRLQPCDLDTFGATYFTLMVKKRTEDKNYIEYQAKMSYVKEQFKKGDSVIVPSEYHSLTSTQTTGSDHLFVPLLEEDRVEDDHTETFSDESRHSSSAGQPGQMSPAPEEEAGKPFMEGMEAEITNHHFDTDEKLRAFSPAHFEMTGFSADPDTAKTDEEKPSESPSQPTVPAKRTRSQPDVPMKQSPSRPDAPVKLTSSKPEVRVKQSPSEPKIPVKPTLSTPDASVKRTSSNPEEPPEQTFSTTSLHPVPGD